MNVVKEINKINQAELDLGLSGASWHDEYKDSAYIFVGGLHYDLTEGDMITIFSQYGEVLDLNMPRDKDTGARKGFAFLMYEDQRSTVLAVDNLNGAKVLEKTLRVDHVKNYTQPKVRNEDGELVEPEEQSFNAKPQLIDDDAANSDSSASSGASIDPEDPMRDYLIAQRKEKKALKKAKKSKGKGKHKDETPEERKARKTKNKERKAKKVKSAGIKGVEDLLNSLGRPDFGISRSDDRGERARRRSPEPSRRSRSRSPRRRSLSRSHHSPYGEERHPPRHSRHLDEEDNRPYEHHSRGRSSRD
ncbi:hypothetical protein GALMADRAFT_219979 [Galerina marginata CBS 339.88]|uniref:RRM domain-containing protein n=1 Tax=Galerina marginata (strain CBS 339.88) TaxID=685588 RepID=A0A067TYI6_GALM3|nr:hypothetical protein GALMADRAFT_219979 [Galerina marginata CBS 339.88]